MENVNITIVGAGVIGLAVAYQLSKNHKDIIVLEQNKSFGNETSSRNSEVIHSGIYYKTASFKAVLCVEGARLLYDFCKIHNIPHKRIGKIIVSTNEQETQELHSLYENGIRNGVSNLSLLTKKEINELERNVSAEEGIFSRDTGIIDSHALMKALYQLGTNNNVLFGFNSRLVGIKKIKEGYILSCSDGYVFNSKIVINCAGLNSDSVALMAGIPIDECKYRLKLCKGTYCSYSGKSPVSRLIYPVPHHNLTGLGIHATVDMGNRLRFGPDTEYVSEINYSVDNSRASLFYDLAVKMIPPLDKSQFYADMAGIRPKLTVSGDKARDFIICEESERGFAGLINLIGIESPGLTSCLAISKKISEMVKFLN